MNRTRDLFVVGNDEDSVLRIYRRDQPGPSLHSQDFASFLQVDAPETDIEGATRIGDRIYWITSHGRNGDGEEQPNRQRLFATNIQIAGDAINLVPVGTAYRSLLEDLARDEVLKSYKLAKAAQQAPEDKGGLNIEGLSRTPEGALLLDVFHLGSSRRCMAAMTSSYEPGVSPAHVWSMIFCC